MPNDVVSYASNDRPATAAGAQSNSLIRRYTASGSIVKREIIRADGSTRVFPGCSPITKTADTGSGQKRE